jgi:hypothetical protein
MRYHRYTADKSAHCWNRMKVGGSLVLDRERCTLVVRTIDALYQSVDRRSLDHYIRLLACMYDT